ncbi:hypothetical protein O1L60_24975 [Streptomyces diastatochromogenes]|nr:hypothetical protein [Streptomyces diastatochromogenes]
MIRSFRRTGALGVCAVAAVAATTFAAAPVSAHSGDGFEFTLYAKEVPASGASASAPAPKVGDVLTFADDYYRSKGGDTVGRDGVTCAVVRVSGTSADVNCVGTIVLNGGPGGQIAAQSLTTIDTSQQSTPAADIAVTGGTGDFKDARGYIRTAPDGDYSRMDFHISTR